VLFSFDVTLSQKLRAPVAVLERLKSWDTLPFDLVRLPRRAYAVPACADKPVVRDALPEKAQGAVPLSKPPLATRFAGAGALLTVTDTCTLSPTLSQPS
jgi:hypothetical protein